MHGTVNSFEKSAQNIDPTFANFTGITGETLEYGTSDHTPLIVYKSEYICLECENFFETVKWKHYEIILCLLQEYWVKQRELMTIIEWYRN
jgi:hypothetical protein